MTGAVADPPGDAARSPGLLHVVMRVRPECEADFHAWYDEEHIPDRLRCPGFLRARRFAAADGSGRYLAIYDLEDVAALDAEEYRRQVADPSPRTLAARGYWSATERTVYREIGRARYPEGDHEER